MLGTIGFKGYQISCIIGLEPHERMRAQDLLVDLIVETDFSRVSESDSLEDTIDYVSLAALCKKMALAGNYCLIEKYASDLIKEIFALYPVKSAAVRIRKPAAIPEAECAFVEFKQEL